MKKLRILLLPAALLLLVLLCACHVEGNPLPEGMEEDKVLEAGREVVRQLNDGDWQGVWDSLREDAQKTATPENIQAVMEDILKRSGDLERETDAMVTGQVLDSGEQYGTAVFYYKHNKKTVSYRIAFSTDMELMGFELDTV